MTTVKRDVTSRALSQLLKAAGSEQVGPDIWLIGPDDMPEEEKEKVQAYTVEYLVRKIPMTLTLDGKPVAFDFCKYQIDGKFMFASSYRPVASPLSNRKSVITGGVQAGSFVDSLGYLLLWLLTNTTAFGQPKKKAEGKPEVPAKKLIPFKQGMTLKPGESAVCEAPIEKPIFEKVEEPVEDLEDEAKAILDETEKPKED